MKLSVLILEDRTTDADLVIHALRQGGFELEWRVVSNKAGFQEALNPDWDLILADYSLPDYDALQALNFLQTRGWEIPLIIVSGTIGEETAVEAMKAGASDYLMKDRLGRLGQAVIQALEQKRNRQEKLHAEAVLRESEERFRQMAEHIEAVFWLTDPRKEEMLYISPAYETIWGRSCASLYDSPQKWMEAIHPEDRARIQAAAKEKQVQGEYDEEYRIVRPDGEVRWIRDRAYPIRDGQGEVYRIAGVAQDITDRLELEKQLRHSQRLEAVGQLAGGVAHDFNNLLMVIRGYTDLLGMSESTPAPVKETLQLIGTTTDRGANLTRQLLAFSRQQSLKREVLDLNQTITNLNKMLRRVIREDIALEIETHPGLPPVEADLTQLEQIVLNLAVNARDAMPNGGQLILRTERVTFSSEEPRRSPLARPGEFVCLNIRDTGVGIAPEIQDRVFEPFFTTKEKGKGSGLGLASALGIAQQHGGWIELESRVGGGTTFRVYLPGRPDSQVQSDASSPLPQSPRGNETILLAEDDPAVRELARDILISHGYRILEAGSGTQALEVWEEAQGRIDLLLTDMIMTDGITGRVLAERLRFRKPALKVILASGYSGEIIDFSWVEREGIEFLAKPFSSHTLTGKVRECLDK